MSPRTLVSLIVALATMAGATACGHREAARTTADAMDETVAVPTSASANRGATLYAKNCAACHGTATAGPVGPWLRGERARKDRSAVVEVIKHPDPPMPKLFPGTLRAQDVADLAAYVETL